MRSGGVDNLFVVLGVRGREVPASEGDRQKEGRGSGCCMFLLCDVVCFGATSYEWG